jgi:serine/threonine protein kinase
MLRINSAAIPASLSSALALLHRRRQTSFPFHPEEPSTNDESPSSPPREAVPLFSTQLLKKYTPIKLLGSGAFGHVYSCRVANDPSAPTVAVKILPKDKSPHVLLEAELLSSVDHPNVVQFIELIESPESYSLVTEELRGPELFKVLVDHDAPFPEDRVLDYVEQMLGAVEACHRKNFAHLDVKIENCVFRSVDLNSPLVLVDFGSADKFVRAPYADKSQHYIEGLDDETKVLRRQAGTIPYCSPEVVNGFFSSRSDVWSVGVCTYVMLTGRRPFESGKTGPLEAQKSIARQIKAQGGNRTQPALSLPLPSHIASPAVAEFLSRLTMGHPAERFSATEAINVLRDLPRKRGFV